jgi:hypothetical protein
MRRGRMGWFRFGALEKGRDDTARPATQGEFRCASTRSCEAGKVGKAWYARFDPVRAEGRLGRQGSVCCCSEGNTGG